MKLIGPFTQLLTMDNLPLKGSLSDDQLEILHHAGVLVDGDFIVEVGDFSVLKQIAIRENISIEWVEGNCVLVPGFIDAHTHICWAGNRADDYSKRLAGKSYLEIANEGGGIWSTVQKTRAQGLEELTNSVEVRANQMLSDGITTIEVKSGYGLNVETELKMLQSIKNANTKADLISTCLAAHILPKDFEGNSTAYLQDVIHKLLQEVKRLNLSNRVDIFIEESAFTIDEARIYLEKAREMGFDLVIHGDQFTLGGSQLAVEMDAVSVDHLEVSDDKAIQELAKSNVVATVLPGASLGLGLPFAPARKLLNAGACVAIASDWNPGSAPMGDLLMQAAVLASYEKLTIAETLAGITVRAAASVNLKDRGVLKSGGLADMAGFSTSDYREIIYRQGKLKPSKVWKKGVLISLNELNK